MEYGAQAVGSHCENHWKLQAGIEAVAALRYSPAGTPILDCILMHTSEVVEADSLRQVQARIQAVALGDVAYQLQQHGLGLQAIFSGFMSTSAKSRAAKRPPTVAFHIQSFTVLEQA